MQRNLRHFGYNIVEHEDVSHTLAIRDVQIHALLSVNIQEKPDGTLVAIAAVIDNECVAPRHGALQLSIALALVAEVRGARDLRSLPAAAVHRQNRTAKLAHAQRTGRKAGAGCGAPRRACRSGWRSR
jgi:hypothetical protein